MMISGLIGAVKRGIITAPEQSVPTERISNGEFSDSTDWELGAGWAIAAGVAANATPGNSLRQFFATELPTGSASFRFDLVANPAGDELFVQLVQANGMTLFYEIGSYVSVGTISATVPVSGLVAAIRFLVPDGGGGAVIDNVSLIA
jgi:hypothetical protein